MKNLFGSPKVLAVTVALIAIVAIPLTIIQVQNQQTIRQEASETSFSTSQSASLVCGAGGFDISVKIKNTASGYSSSSVFTVTAKDSQTNQSVALGTVQPGSTAQGVIHTSKTSMKSGKITFVLTKPGSYSSSTTKSADYTAGSPIGYGYGYSSGSATCTPQATPTPPPYSQPTPTPTPVPYGQPTPTPTLTPSPTAKPSSNPTLGPVQNVHIDCPNCVKQ